MNLKEIVFRTTPNYEVDELIHLLEQYIKIRKGKTVKIQIMFISPLDYTFQINSLIQAANVAQAWLIENYKDDSL